MCIYTNPNLLFDFLRHRLTPSSSRSVCLSHVPAEIWVGIFNRTSVKDVKALLLVSRKWNVMTQQSFLYKSHKITQQISRVLPLPIGKWNDWAPQIFTIRFNKRGPRVHHLDGIHVFNAANPILYDIENDETAEEICERYFNLKIFDETFSDFSYAKGQDAVLGVLFQKKITQSSGSTGIQISKSLWGLNVRFLNDRLTVHQKKIILEVQKYLKTAIVPVLSRDESNGELIGPIICENCHIQ
ncbi:MAG: hypothetical protein K940chlam3_01639 [Chlamydiae bacterium]|nr:hypothetical protein [Chlamydiota bacterium]